MIVSKQDPCLTAIEEDGGDKRLAQLEHAVEADGVTSPDPNLSGQCAIAKAILMRISVEQVPSLHRDAPRYLKLVTFSNFWPFMPLMFVLVVMVLLCPVLTSISYALALSTSLLVRSGSSSFLPPTRPVSSATIGYCGRRN